jgi:hypothetical protein
VSPADVEQHAAQVLKDAIKARRLPRRPDFATLNRIAAFVAPVLQQKKQTAARSNERRPTSHKESTRVMTSTRRDHRIARGASLGGHRHDRPST